MRLLNQLFGLVGDLYSAGTVVARLFVIIAVAAIALPWALAIAMAHAGANNALPWLLLGPLVGAVMIIFIAPLENAAIWSTKKGKLALAGLGVLFAAMAVLVTVLRFTPTKGSGGLVLLLTMLTLALAFTVKEKMGMGTKALATLCIVGLLVVEGAIWHYSDETKKDGDKQEDSAGSPWAGTPTPKTVGRICPLNEEGEIIGDCSYVDTSGSSDTHVRWRGVGIDGWQNLEWGSGQCEWYVDGTKVPRGCSFTKTGPETMRFAIPKRSGGVTHLGVYFGG